MSRPAPGDLFHTRLRALTHRNFRLFWSGQLVSLIGTWMQSVAQGWLMHRLTGSAFMLGLLGFAQFLPVMLLSLWAGVVADRMDKRRLIITTQTLALVQAALLAVVVTLGVVQPWMVVGLALAFGIVNAFDLPARQSFLVEMVGKEDLPNAIALNSAAFNTARVMGPAVAGVVMAAAGEGACFWVNAISYLAVLAMLLRMDLTPYVADADTGKSTLTTLREGVGYALGTPQIRNLLVLLGITAGLGFQYMVLLPVYAREILGANEQVYGFMVSAFGLGSGTCADPARARPGTGWVRGKVSGGNSLLFPRIRTMSHSRTPTRAIRSSSTIAFDGGKFRSWKSPRCKCSKSAGPGARAGPASWSRLL